MKKGFLSAGVFRSLKVRKKQKKKAIKKTVFCTCGIWKVLKTGLFFPAYWLHSLKEIDFGCRIWIYLPFPRWKFFTTRCCPKVAICDTLRFCNSTTFLVPTRSSSSLYVSLTGHPYSTAHASAACVHPPSSVQPLIECTLHSPCFLWGLKFSMQRHLQNEMLPGLFRGH